MNKETKPMKVELEKLSISEFDKEVKTLINDTTEAEKYVYVLDQYHTAWNSVRSLYRSEVFTNFKELVSGLANYEIPWQIAQADEIVSYIPDNLNSGYFELNKRYRDDEGPLMDMAKYMVCDMMRNGIEYTLIYDESFVVSRKLKLQHVEAISDILLRLIKYQLKYCSEQDTENNSKSNYTPFFLEEDATSYYNKFATWRDLDLLTESDRDDLLEHMADYSEWFIDAHRDYTYGLQEYKDWVSEFCKNNGVSNTSELDDTQNELFYNEENDYWFDGNYGFNYYIVDEIIEQLIGHEMWEKCVAIDSLRNEERKGYDHKEEITSLIEEVFRNVSDTTYIEEISKELDLEE